MTYSCKVKIYYLYYFYIYVIILQIHQIVSNERKILRFLITLDANNITLESDFSNVYPSPRDTKDEEKTRGREGDERHKRDDRLFVERQNDPRNWVTRHVDRISCGVFHCGSQKRARKRCHFDLPLL